MRTRRPSPPLPSTRPHIDPLPLCPSSFCPVQGGGADLQCNGVTCVLSSGGGGQDGGGSQVVLPALGAQGSGHAGGGKESQVTHYPREADRALR